MLNPTVTAPHYLLLDRSDPKNPRWVIAQARVSLPADIAADADDPDRPTGWLATFGHDHLRWLADNLDYHPNVRIPQPGKQCYSTRIIANERVHLEYDRYGLGWYDGWDGVVYDTWVDPRHRPPFDPDDQDDDEGEYED